MYSISQCVSIYILFFQLHSLRRIFQNQYRVLCNHNCILGIHL
nr:MAG TPA: hypothetical protein [Caudoviricetes sp.]